MKLRFVARALVLALPLGLCQCGEDAPPAAAPESGKPGAPVGSDPAAGESALLRTPRQLLGSLHHRLVTGEGLYDQAWQDDVRRVAEALWPADDAGIVPAAGRTHVQLAGIAGSTARYVLRDDDEGTRYLEDNPEDRVVHDVYLAAVVIGPDRYKAWCESEGPRVLATWKTDRRQRILGK